MGRPKNSENQNGGLLNNTSAAEGGEQESQTATQIDENGSAQNLEQSGAGADNLSQDGAEGAETSETSETSTNKDGEQGSNNEPKELIKRVRHPDKKNKKIIVGADVVEFDAAGIAELNTEQAEYLLGIPGYEAVKGDA